MGEIMDNHKIYFTKESPDWNNMIEISKPERLAANRVVLSIMSEYGLCNDRRMSPIQFSNFIKTTQIAAIVTE
jgi:hypothetical protein